MARFFGIYVEASTPGSTFPRVGFGNPPQDRPNARVAPRPAQRLDTNPPAGVGPLPAQGTRANVAMGHQGGPKNLPTDTQFGGHDEIPTTQSTQSQVRGWPANPAYPILPTPGSREMVLRTDSEMQAQPAPPRILRYLFARNMGNIGESGHQFPMNADLSYLPHRDVPRVPQRTGPLRRQYDDNAPIPATYAGNPRS